MFGAEPLEPRLFFASTRFAVIGDYGAVSPEAGDVADLVRSKDPDFIVTVGDNNYPGGARDTLDGNVGRYYHEYIYPYEGDFGGGSPTGKNRFFPVLGNHDYDSEGGRPFFDYFSLPGNERYYSFKRGPVQFFMIDSDPRAAGLGYVDEETSTAGSAQGRWLRKALGASTAKYKLVVMHHAPYSSGESHGPSRFVQWPFRKWGATAVLAGHEHLYERFDKQGTPFFINGLGGRSFRGFSDTPASGSRFRFTGDYGAMIVGANEQRIVFKFLTRSGEQIDRYEITAVPAAPTRFEAAGGDPGGVSLSWRDAAANESFFKVQRSIDGTGFETVARVEANVTSFLDAGAEADVTYAYRVRAMNDDGASEWVTLAHVG